jgi:hypothetical protein
MMPPAEPDPCQDQPPFANAIGKILYPIVMILLLAWNLVSATAMAFFASSLLSDQTTPGWFHYMFKGLTTVGGALEKVDGNLNKIVETIITFIVAIIMGIFLNRCSGRRRNFEIAIVVLLILAAVPQFAVFFIFPSPEAANAAVVNGAAFVKYFQILINKNLYVLVALCGAAFGSHLSARGRV